jgi:hypothetical protein
MFSAARYIARATRTLRHKIQPHNVAPRCKILSPHSRKFKAGYRGDKWRHSAVDWRSLAAIRGALGVKFALNFKLAMLRG